MGGEKFSSLGSFWGDLHGRSLRSVLQRPFLLLGNAPNYQSHDCLLVLQLLFQYLSQFPGPHAVLFPFSSLFSLCFIVMGFAEQLLTLDLLSDGSVFFSCRLCLCIVLLNCWMNAPEPSVTESFPHYISFGRTVVLML